ncbi:MAG TPA: hypothetical protein VMF31_05465 [Solirubrobacterales bacterium]|nr:hypothetical protein [Solirubrobacterales bacterium]
MKADFDSEANALSIDLIEARRWDASLEIDGDFCRVAFERGVAANIELLSPADHLDLLEEASAKAGIEHALVDAAARSALAAPNRLVTIEFSAPA